MGGLDIGEHNVLLDLELPENVTSGIIYVTVKIGEQEIPSEPPEIEEPIEQPVEEPVEDIQEDPNNQESIDPDGMRPELTE